MGMGGKYTFVGEGIGVLDAACHGETSGQDGLGSWDIHFGQKFNLIRFL
jgi:hypothetical protein